MCLSHVFGKQERHELPGSNSNNHSILLQQNGSGRGGDKTLNPKMEKEEKMRGSAEEGG